MLEWRTAAYFSGGRRIRPGGIHRFVGLLRGVLNGWKTYILDIHQLLVGGVDLGECDALVHLMPPTELVPDRNAFFAVWAPKVVEFREHILVLVHGH